MTSRNNADGEDTLPLSAVNGRELVIALTIGIAIILLLLAALAAVSYFRLLSTAHATRFDLVFGFIAYAALIAPVWYAAIHAPRRGWADIGLRRSPEGYLILGGLGAFLWAGLSAGISGAAGMWDIAIAAGGNLVRPFRNSAADIALLLVLAGPVAALAEEILFRGLLYGWLRRRMGILLSAVVSSAIFTVCHVYVFAAGIPFVVEMAALSILLALLFEYSRSLWPGILCHAANNLIVLILYIQLN